MLGLIGLKIVQLYYDHMLPSDVGWAPICGTKLPHFREV
jgi:hypothetical protein